MGNVVFSWYFGSRMVETLKENSGYTLFRTHKWLPWKWISLWKTHVCIWIPREQFWVCFSFNTTMFDFIQFPPKCKHTALKYVGDTSTNIKYTRKKPTVRLQYSFLVLLLLPFLHICTKEMLVSKEEPRAFQLMRLVGIYSRCLYHEWHFLDTVLRKEAKSWAVKQSKEVWAVGSE